MKKINIFLGAILLSIWSVILFFGKHIGLSMLLFAIPITYYIVTLLEKNNKIKKSAFASCLLNINTKTLFILKLPTCFSQQAKTNDYKFRLA